MAHEHDPVEQLSSVVSALRAIQPRSPAPGSKDVAPAIVPKCPRITELRLPSGHQPLKKFQRRAAPDLPVVEEIVKDGHPYDVIGRALAAYYGVEVMFIYGLTREQPSALVRQIMMYLIVRVLEVPQAEVGRVFGYDHTTIMSGCNKVAKLRTLDARLDEQLTAFGQQFAPLREKVAPFRRVVNSPLTQAMYAIVQTHRQAESQVQAQSAAELGLTSFPPGMSPSRLRCYHAIVMAFHAGKLEKMAAISANLPRMLTLRFGLDQLDRPVYRTLQEVADLMNVSRQRALQIEQRAFKLLGITKEKSAP
ncbi:hypothetical protein HYW17_01075 [Candidatus Uhrbacteria bacterium]|nr:hypothetical protein [Candidatus Uhrbacteria bacterium]